MSINGRIVFCDAEFRSSNMPHPEALCFVARDVNEPVDRRYWLQGAGEREVLRCQLEKWRSENCIFAAYSAAAEARIFSAVGVNPLSCRWFDVMVAYLWYRNRPDRKYVMPLYGLLEAAEFCKVPTGDKATKRAMQDFALLGDFTEESAKQKLLTYCQEDVRILHDVYVALSQLNGVHWAESFEDLTYLSRYSAAMAVLEDEGIPISDERVDAICRNYSRISETFVLDASVKLALWRKDSDGWHFVYDRFVRYLEGSGLNATWPRTTTGKYSLDKDDIRLFVDPTLKDVLGMAEVLRQLGSTFRGRPSDKWSQHHGPDGRQRIGFGVYGTHTGRNAPGVAQGFVPAMSTWLRCIIEPPKGQIIIGADYSQQERLIGASLSGDRKMADDCATDPYTAFGIAAGMIPPGGTKKTHPHERQLCKSLVLGTGYGMGIESLTRKISTDMGENIPRETAQRLLDAHNQTYTTYLSWRKKIMSYAHNYPRLELHPDGWRIACDAERANALANWPVQSTGGVILRRAILNCLDAGLRVIFPLHDSIYIIAGEDEAEEKKAKLVTIMVEAAQWALKPPSLQVNMKVDVSVHRHGEFWVDDKGIKSYSRVAPLLGWPEHNSQ